ncbi:MAG: B12-binding domain-containing radical SAM protein [Candidatus Omnitrophica bacterium]|jgi:radical SAM superfamily enzyme YgiQ (UPF0313 family)|nr:B12-binding domain-containing radical SAM protein [Candidatus Omnitrophota bacterium]
MEKFKNLLVNPVIGFSPPFSLLYLAAVLEKSGRFVQIEELNTYGKKEFSFDQLLNKIAQENIDLVGFVCLSSHTEVLKKLIPLIKKNYPAVKVIVGGTHATALPEFFLNLGADVAVLGEGESILLKTVEHLEQNVALNDVASIVFKDSAGKYIKTKDRVGFEDVSKLPMPAYHLINAEHYIANNYAIRGLWLRCGWVFTARGCPGRCTFCASAITHGYEIRERSIKDVVDELEFLKRNYKIEAFWILDDTFVIRPERVFEFCEQIKKRKLNLTWACQARVNYLTDSVAKKLKESGCVQVDLGVESGSQKVLNAIKKGITIDLTKKAFAAAHKNKLRALATIMIGSPQETREDLEMTRKLLKEIKPDYLGIGFCTPYPGSELYQQASAQGWIKPEEIFWDTQGHNARPVMFINFNEKELYQIYDSMVQGSFYKTVLDYLKQPKFILDLFGIVLKHPILIWQFITLCLTCRSKDFINLFRKYRITGEG